MKRLPRQTAAGLIALCWLCACGTSRPAPAPPAGVMLLSLADGSLKAQAALGQDPLAVAVGADGRSAFVSDNAAGKVFCLALPSLLVRWTANLGGRPGPILVQPTAIWVSLYAAGQVAELDAASGRLLALWPVGPGPGQIVAHDGALYAAGAGGVWRLLDQRVAASSGFGLASTGGGLWAAVYDRGQVVRLADGRAIQLPPALHPFWLAPREGGGLLVAAEGDDEDSDPGAVFSLEPPEYQARMLLAATDPDQVVEAGGRIFVAAHGSRKVDVLSSRGEPLGGWAPGSAPVALAIDAPLASLLVVTDERE